MASLPSLIEVSGRHNAIFEAYYKQLDPKCTGIIEALDAAKFLKKSGLSDVVLSRIWDLSDPKGRGFLDKSGFFVAVKLVSLAQEGIDLNMRNILKELMNPPKIGEIPKILSHTIQSVSTVNADWSMKPAEKFKYEKLFESLQPVNGMIAGNKVKGVLMDSKLPLETLGKIWDLADEDKDGNLDKHEFTIAMHLVYQILDKRAVPAMLPPELRKFKQDKNDPPNEDGFGDEEFVANFPNDIAPPPIPSLPVAGTVVNQTLAIRGDSVIPMRPTDTITPISSTAPILPIAVASYDWVVTPVDKVRYEKIFEACDTDKDGLVSGHEVKSVFLQSGLPQNCLAHIWALCDTNQSGKLTVEQFALAMWFVERKQNGVELPEALAPKMMPPTLRGSVGVELLTIQQETKPCYSNPELKMITQQVEELTRERRILESDITQREADIRIKSGEVRSLQSELDTLTTTLRQLENQKGEAQKRLEDLKSQGDKIREQCQKQEATIFEQEEELNSKRSELQKLQYEETALEKDYECSRYELDSLTKQHQDTQLQISQVKAMLTQLLETQRQMNDALLQCKAAIETDDAATISNYSLKLEPGFAEAKHALTKFIEVSKPDKNRSVGHTDNAVISANSNNTPISPFSNMNGCMVASKFVNSFSNSSISGFDDPFGSLGFRSNQIKDPFSATPGHSYEEKTAKGESEPEKDEFGSDPFAILHAPTSAEQILSPRMGPKSGPPPRPESPSPALPPKKSKQPPPRPAPPRPLQAPIIAAQAGAYSFEPSSGFADFGDFDKLPAIMPSTAPYTSIPQQHNTVTSSYLVAKATSNQILVALPDFLEDPFKDYRYEDTSSIKDPFADDENYQDSPDGKARQEKFNNESFCGKSTGANSVPTLKGNYVLSNSFEMVDERKLASDDFFSTFNDNFQNLDQGSSKLDSDPYFDTFNGINTPSFGAFDDDFGTLLSDSHLKSEKLLTTNDVNMTKKVSTSKIPDKFFSDYSRVSDYGNDLQTVLQRSLEDQ